MAVKCEECGKEYDGSKEKVQLRAHIIRAHGKLPEGDPATKKYSEPLEEKIARLRKLRSERGPIGILEKRWACPKDDGYHYRVFNDDWMTKPANIQRAKEIGYEFVDSKDEKQKVKVVGVNDDGTPIRGYLMRIPKEIYDEDQMIKQKAVDKVDEQIKAGKFQQGANDNRYIPAMGITIVANNRVPE